MSEDAPLSTVSSGSWRRWATPQQELRAQKGSSMFSLGTTSTTASSKRSRTSTSPAASQKTSKPSAGSDAQPTPAKSSGSGSTAEDGSSSLSSERKKRATAFSRLLKSAVEKRGVTTRQLSEQTGLSPHLINRYRSNRSSQLPLPKTAAKLADALMEPRLRSLASLTTLCEVCSTEFELQSKKRDSNRYCSTRCQRHARNARESEHANHRLSAENAILKQQRDTFTVAVREFCNSCALGTQVCPDATCPLAPVTHLPKE